MNIPEELPTEAMINAGLDVLNNGWYINADETCTAIFKAMLTAAPTPQEDEPVAYQAWHPNFPTWVSCSKSVAEQFLERNEGHTIRPLYTRPDNLRKAAEELVIQWDANISGIRDRVEDIRAALEGK